MSLAKQFMTLSMPLPIADRGFLWWDWFTKLMGLPMLVAVAFGLAVYCQREGGAGDIGRSNRLAVGMSVALGMVYLCVSSGIPFYRQTSLLQPFFCLFAGLAVVPISSWCGEHAGRQLVVAAALLATIGAVPWAEAAQVFQAHLGLGRAVEWAYTHKGDRKLHWMMVYTVTLPTVEDIERANPDAYLLTYFPGTSYGARLRLTSCPTSKILPYWLPTRVSGGLESVRAEVIAVYTPPEFRFQPALAKARVYRLGDLQALMRGQTLGITSITADSVQSPAHEAVKVFDRGRSPEGATAWISADTGRTHYLEMEFAGAVRLGQMRLVLPSPLGKSRGVVDGNRGRR